MYNKFFTIYIQQLVMFLWVTLTQHLLLPWSCICDTEADIISQGINILLKSMCKHVCLYVGLCMSVEVSTEARGI